MIVSGLSLKRESRPHKCTPIFRRVSPSTGLGEPAASDNPCYCFTQPPGSDYPPILNAHEIHEPFKPFVIAGPGGTLPILAFGQGHGQIRSLGFRFGPFAYSSDVDGLDEAAFAALQGVECWIVDALRRTPHPSHAHLAKTLEWIARVRPQRAVLTNMHLDMDYGTLCRELPAGVEPAFDGMRLTLPAQ